MSAKKKRIGEHLLSECPKCKTHRLKIWDEGYSSFNCGGIKCECGYEFDAGCALSCFPAKEIADAWNKHAKAAVEAMEADAKLEAWRLLFIQYKRDGKLQGPERERFVELSEFVSAYIKPLSK